MGIFSSSIKTYVSSTVYNLAGDEDLRPNFLSTTIIGSAVVNEDASTGSAIITALFKGTGMKQKQFFLWAKTKYGLGMPVGTISGDAGVDTATVKSGITATLTLAANETVRVTRALIDDADPDYFAEDWIRKNYPTELNNTWSVEYNSFSGMLEISGTWGVVYVAPSADLIWGLDRSSDRKLLYALYSVLTEDTTTGEISESTPEYFVYRMNSGNVVFDTLYTDPTVISEFFPAIPLRLNNVPIDDASLASTYATVKTAYRRLTGKPVSDLLATIEDNEQIDDVDFAFLVQAVSLNVKEEDCKAYLYDFFLYLAGLQQTNKQTFTEYEAQLEQFKLDANTWDRWAGARERDPFNPAYQEDAPVVADPAFTPPTVNELKVVAENLTEYDFRLRWAFINETQHIGNAARYDGNKERELLGQGKYWFHLVDDYTVKTRTLNTQGGEAENAGQYEYLDVPYSRVYLLHQHKQLQYRKLELVGLEHRNYVYNSKSVIITGREALEDEDESGFLIPLHYPTLKNLSLVKVTQMTTANTFIVFNSYQEVKVKWYQKAIFKIIVVLASVAIAVIFPPSAGLGSVTGIFGTNAAVGALVAGAGASVATAAIVGAVVNGLAGMLIANLIQKYSAKIFGDKLGAIIGTLITFVAFNYGAEFFQTGSFDIDWSAMMRADNLMALTDSVSKAASNWMAADTAEIYEEIAGLGENYKDEMDKIAKLTEEIIGLTGEPFDPMMLTDVQLQYGEPSDVFLDRTLLTGSDIAELTHSLIDNFADLSLELPKKMG